MPEGGGGDQSINLLVGLNSTYFIMKLKLLSKLRSCVTFGRVEEIAKHIDWGIFAGCVDMEIFIKLLSYGEF